MKPSPYTDRYSPQEIDRYYESGLWASETFHDLLVRRVEQNPDKVFATDGTRSLTYRELFDAGQRLAVGLHRQGLRRGDTAAVQLPNTRTAITPQPPRSDSTAEDTSADSTKIVKVAPREESRDPSSAP